MRLNATKAHLNAPGETYETFPATHLHRGSTPGTFLCVSRLTSLRAGPYHALLVEAASHGDAGRLKGEAMQLSDLEGRWEHFEPVALSVGLTLKTPLDRDSAMRALAALGRQFPQLTESDFDGKGNKFVFRNEEADAPKQAFLRMREYRALEMAWGPKVPINFDDAVSKLFNTVQDTLDLPGINVEFFDLELQIHSEWTGNHYKAILTGLLDTPPLAAILDPDRIVQDDLLLRGLLDDKRICLVRVISDVADDEVRRQSFSNDTLKLKAGVAQTHGIPIDSRLAELFTDHAAIATRFFLDKFIPNIVDPMERAIAQLSAEGEE